MDLESQHQKIRDNIRERIDRVLKHGQFIMGPEIKELEQKLAAFVDVRHAISCSSGTEALLLALMAYEVKPGDAIFTTTFTFIATAEVIAQLGATPVFVDIDSQTKNIDPKALEDKIRQVQKEGKLRLRGIIPVDLFGLPADYEALERIATQYGLFIIEDAAQSFGATYKGKKAGRLGNVSTTSFFPAKPLGCYGDGGAVFTNDDNLAEKMKSMRVHGQGGTKYHHVQLGLNARLDTLQAAILLAKLEIFDWEIESRQKAAAIYSKGLKDIVETPQVPDGVMSAWAQYSIVCPQRDTLIELLTQESIPTAIYYPIPLHLQPAFSYLGYKKADYPVSESIAEKIISLPMHPYLKENQINFIIQTIQKTFKT